MTRSLAVDVFPTPSISYSGLSPLIIVFGLALAGVLIEAFVGSEARQRIQPPLTIGGFAAALVAVVALAHRRELTASGAVAIDGPSLFLSGTILVFGIAAVLLVSERSLDAGALVADAAVVPGQIGSRSALATRNIQTEAYPLLSFAVGGMMLFAAASNLLLMFVALEVLSLPLYLMAGLARRRRLVSQEAAMKYFLLGAFSSAFFLYGLALIYGYAGSVDLGAIADATSTVGKSDALLYPGIGLLAVGLLFKVGAAPFHNWTPDVYQGSPTPVTAFMAAATKVSAFGALLRVFYVAFGNVSWDWRPLIWAIAIITMIVGAVVAVTQTDVKRLLAYSSIAHVGFILVGVAAATRAGTSSTLFYLVTYGFTTIGAFAVVTLVRDGGGEATHLSRWAGLGRTSPLVAGIFAVFLFALAGIPLTSGFTGKFAVFQAAIEGHATPLVIVGVITSAIAAFFYARVVVLMFFAEPVADPPYVAIPSPSTAAALGLGLAVTIALGVFPQPLLDLANSSALFYR